MRDMKSALPYLSSDIDHYYANFNNKLDLESEALINVEDVMKYRAQKFELGLM